jgi:metal-responsive CopG/Arc/MetJ family transcriptional regulator
MDRFLPQKVEKEVISMRITSSMLAELDRKSAEIGISRNELINQCIAFALANMGKPEENR